MNAIQQEAHRLHTTPSLPSAIEAEEKKVIRFKITEEGRDKSLQSKAISGQVIQVLKRAKEPLGLRAIASRVAATKVGKESTVKDVKQRARTCAKWWAKHESNYVGRDEKGRLYLIEA